MSEANSSVYRIGVGSAVTDGTAMEEAIARAVRLGEHVWVITGVWRVDPQQGESDRFLDHENLLSLGGPGCLVCEAGYDPRIATRRCKGEPRRSR